MWTTNDSSPGQMPSVVAVRATDDAVDEQVLGPLEGAGGRIGGVVERSADRAGVEAGGRERLLDAFDRGSGVVELDRRDLDGAAVEFDRRLGDDVGGRNDACAGDVDRRLRQRHRRRRRSATVAGLPRRRRDRSVDDDTDPHDDRDGDRRSDARARSHRAWISWWDRVCGSVGAWRPCIGCAEPWGGCRQQVPHCIRRGEPRARTMPVEFVVSIARMSIRQYLTPSHVVLLRRPRHRVPRRTRRQDPARRTRVRRSLPAEHRRSPVWPSATWRACCCRS